MSSFRININNQGSHKIIKKKEIPSKSTLNKMLKIIKRFVNFYCERKLKFKTFKALLDFYHTKLSKIFFRLPKISTKEVSAVSLCLSFRLSAKNFEHRI